MSRTRFYGGGVPLVMVTATATGVELTISRPEGDFDTEVSCLVSLDEFRRLIADSPAVIAETETKHAAANHDALIADRKGHH